MGSADSFVRDGWHEKAVVDAEKTVGDDSLESALTEQEVPSGRRTRRYFSDAFERALIEQSGSLKFDTKWCKALIRTARGLKIATTAGSVARVW